MKDGESGLRLGHATMDVRYRDGGYESKPTASLSSYRMLEFNPMDVIVLRYSHSTILRKWRGLHSIPVQLTAY